MATFLSSPLFAQLRLKYGKPHPLFDTLQVLFSHLLLNHQSRMAHHISSSRDNYDLVQVYNWNQPFTALYIRLPDEEQETPSPPPFKSSLFPKLRSPSPKPPAVKYDLDMHTLLHIRNFWHRHLIDDTSGNFLNQSTMGENTYAAMAKGLVKLKHAPRKWNKPLLVADSDISQVWYGHYSCIHPWPKKREDLDERQSCAEDWASIDPMVCCFVPTQCDFADLPQALKFRVASTDDNVCYWPPLFSAIPAFANTIPSPFDPSFETIRHIRGIAPFVELMSNIVDCSSDRKASHPPPSLPKHHPYLALRIRGLIHHIKPQEGIPGWQRITMVLYKPNTTYLLRVLEHSAEEYGGVFWTAITPQVAGAAAATSTVNGVTPAQAQALFAGNTTDLDPVVAEKFLQGHLVTKLSSNPAWRDGSHFTVDEIEHMEESYSISEHLEWTDIEYAYAYEGIMIPGGKIMMGRWWRCGLFGVGNGLEVGVDGLGVEVIDGSVVLVGGNAGDDDDVGAEPGNERRPRARALERGPWVFWCD